MIEKIFKLQNWNPKTHELAKAVIDEIHAAAPELEVLFMGAAALKLPGNNDVDLDVLCQAKDVPRHQNIILRVKHAPGNN